MRIWFVKFKSTHSSLWKLAFPNEPPLAVNLKVIPPDSMSWKDG